MNTAAPPTRTLGAPVVRALAWLRRAVSWPIRIRSSKIGFRLFLSFQVVIILTGLIGIRSIQRFNTMSAMIDEMNRHDLPEVKVLGTTLATLYRLRRISLDPGQKDTAKGINLASTLGDLASERTKLIDFEQSVGPSPTPVKDSPAVDALFEGLDRARTVSLQVKALVDAGEIGAATQVANTQLLPLIQRNIQLADELSVSETNEATLDAALVQQITNTATEEILILTSLSVIASILLAVLMTRSVVRPLSELLRATEAIATGDLEVRPRVQRRDELGRLASAFDSMRHALRETISNLKREQRRTQAIIDATADGVVLVDERRTIVQMNPAAERLSGWSAEEAVGHSCCEVFGCQGEVPSEASGQSRRPHRDLGASAFGSPREFHARFRDGRRRWLAENSAPILSDPDNDRRFVVGFHDVTQLKAVEQMKTDFVAMVSHELRAPLTTVLGSVEMLASLDPGSDREASDEVLSLLQHQTQRLQNVVEEVLQLTRFEAGRLKVRFQKLAVSPFVQAMLDQLPGQWLGDVRSVELHASDASLAVWADSGLLEVVLRNLLENARQYTPTETPIEIEVGEPTPAGRVEIRVVDHGPGIPPDQCEVIFDRFARGASEAQDTRGYGLGLYIARELVRSLGGEIWAAPRDGGACFVVSLPLVADEPAKNPEAIRSLT